LVQWRSQCCSSKSSALVQGLKRVRFPQALFPQYIKPMQNPNTYALRSAIKSVPFRVAVLASGAIALGALAMNYTDDRATVGYTQVCYKPQTPKLIERGERLGKKYCTYRPKTKTNGCMVRSHLLVVWLLRD
jgi:hypothetical protein